MGLTLFGRHMAMAFTRRGSAQAPKAPLSNGTLHDAAFPAPSRDPMLGSHNHLTKGICSSLRGTDGDGHQSLLLMQLRLFCCRVACVIFLCVLLHQAAFEVPHQRRALSISSNCCVAQNSSAEGGPYTGAFKAGRSPSWGSLKLAPD